MAPPRAVDDAGDRELGTFKRGYRETPTSIKTNMDIERESGACVRVCACCRECVVEPSVKKQGEGGDSKRSENGSRARKRETHADAHTTASREGHRNRYTG